jgi:gamma-glutamyl:cysteine ligase YbdK (ATP-grasp superfamily)
MSETTIGVDDDTRERINSLKEEYNQTHKEERDHDSDSFLNMALDVYEEAKSEERELTENRAREIAREEITNRVNPRALE